MKFLFVLVRLFSSLVKPEGAADVRLIREGV